MDKTKPNYVVNINGGAGKNLMFTGVAKNIKKAYPDHNLIVISPYPEILLNHPAIDRVYRAGATPYIYEDFVKGNDQNIISAVEPYGDGAHLQEKEHLIQTWSRLLNAGCSFQMPDLDINIREMNHFQSQYAAPLKNFEKPIFVINPFGGNNPHLRYNWCRDLPFLQAQKIVNALNTDFLVVQIVRGEQPRLDGAVHFTGNGLREVACMLRVAQKRLLIDSFCQHASAAMGLKSTVCWIANKPHVFGYELHNNVVANDPEKKIHRVDSVFQEDNWEGVWLHYYPYQTQDIFNVEKIMEKLF